MSALRVRALGVFVAHNIVCVADIKEEHGDPVEHEETGFLGPHSIHIYAKSRETKMCIIQT